MITALRDTIVFLLILTVVEVAFYFICS